MSGDQPVPLVANPVAAAEAALGQMPWHFPAEAVAALGQMPWHSPAAAAVAVAVQIPRHFHAHHHDLFRHPCRCPSCRSAS